jgi:mannosyltransferase OCH1-like enzyme
MFKLKSEILREKKQKMENLIKEIETHKKKLNEVKMYKKLYIPFIIKQKYDSVIPLNLFTSWHTKHLPPLMQINYQKLVNQHNNFTHYIFDENECRQFIKNNFNSDILYAYDKLIPCAYKSDLWRYCVLYVYGGIYIDIKFQCVNNFNLIALTEKEYFVKDIRNNYIYNALISCKKNNPILLKCIEQIAVNVRNNYYGENSLMPTGPGLLGRYFTDDEFNNFDIYHKFTEVENMLYEYYLIYKDRIILKMYNGYREEQKQFQKNKRYGELWDDKNIYYK